MSQQVLKRKCYIFECTLKKLEILLTLNAVNDAARKPVNLVALNTNLVEDCKYLNKVIVGQASDPNSSITTTQQVQFEKNLRELCICYKKVYVIQVIPPSFESVTAGIYRQYLVSLSTYKIKIISTWISSGYGTIPESYIFEVYVCDLDEAIAILSRYVVPTSEPFLKINTSNVYDYVYVRRCECDKKEHIKYKGCGCH